MQRDREPEHDEGDDLSQAAEHAHEPGDVAAPRVVDVADEDSGDEDGQEPRSVRGTGARRRPPARAPPLRGGTAPGPGDGPGASRSRSPSHRRRRPPGPHRAGERTRRWRPDRAPPGPGTQDADHQRDAHRVVRPGLAFEQRPGAARDLTPAQHGEDHGRIGRGERGAQEQRRPPAETEQAVREQRPWRPRSRACRRCRRQTTAPATGRSRRRRCAFRRRTGSAPAQR